jgi:hypothetical protein
VHLCKNLPVSDLVFNYIVLLESYELSCYRLTYYELRHTSCGVVLEAIAILVIPGYCPTRANA